MKIITAEEAETDLRLLIASANQEKQHYKITSDVGSIVLLPEETYHHLIVTLELLATPGLMKGISILEESYPE